MSKDLYTHHFGFSERPFSLLPDPSFLYWSKAHSRAFSVLEYGMTTRAPLTVITGEVGTGKTTLIQALLGLISDDITVGLISNAQGGRGDLLRWVLNAYDLKAPRDADYVELFQLFQNFILDEYAEGRFVTLIIDEAQNLCFETLEELRMLTNINSNKDELLQLILLGQPELRTMITRPELRQFAQRVSTAYHLSGMDLDTTRQYVNHRLGHVGGTGHEIENAAVIRIHAVSRGIPRVINKICDLALVYAASGGENRVTLTLLEELIEDGLILLPENTAFLLTNRVDTHTRGAAE